MKVAIKPFRAYSEYEVVNLFALDAASGDKGALVKIKGDGFKNGQDLLFTSITNVDQVISMRPQVPWTMELGASGDGKDELLGMMLYDVREVNQWNYPLLYDAVRRDELQCCISGQAVPVVKRGLFLVSGAVGTPGPNSGVLVDDSGDGAWKVVPAGTAGSIGKFLGVTDAQGFALFSLEL